MSAADVSDHNDPKWLAVARWSEVRHGNNFSGKANDWCVMRTCRCHYGEAVTMPLPTKERAERAYGVLAKYNRENHNGRK